MTTPLMIAAGAVREARAELERIDDQQAELRKRLEEMNGQEATLAGYEERRAQLLEEALLSGRKADTAEVDKHITSAQRAIERRKDERTAVERALPALQAQREAASAILTERRAKYEQVSAEHVAACVRKEIPTVGELAMQFSTAVRDVRACINLMPPATPERWELTKEVDTLIRSLELLTLNRDGPWADNVQMVCTQSSAAGPTTSQAQAALDQARELAGIPEMVEPTTQPAQEAQESDYCWSDGTIHADPEPAPSNPVRVITARRESHVGLVEQHRQGHSYVPGLVTY